MEKLEVPCWRNILVYIIMKLWDMGEGWKKIGFFFPHFVFRTIARMRRKRYEICPREKFQILFSRN